MDDVTHISVPAPIDDVTLPVADLEIPLLWSRIALGAVLLLSVFMNFFQLGQNGYGNIYYAAGIRSMADNFHNFFFVSFDPGGFVTVDKPPLGFWLQAISTKIFGFTPFSIFLPQALCGVLAVWLLYALVRRHFGVVAGLVAALALAVSPISVVTGRNNTIDGTLALVLLLAAWAVIHAAEGGRLRWLLLSALLVGLGFNIKMAEAYLVVPALIMTYLLCAPHKIWWRIAHLALFGVVMLAVSLFWVMAVDLTPVAQRPYVGSTQNNSEVSLAFGYNGLNRLRIGGNGAGGNRPFAGPLDSNIATNPGSAGTGGTEPRRNRGTNSDGDGGNTGNTADRPQAAPGGGGAFESGSPGLFRLFSASLGGQIAWLLPFALLGILALLWQKRFNFRRDRQQLGLVLWGFWLLTMGTFFTLDGSFHQYYMTEMAPGLSAMVGIGLVVMWKDYCQAGWRGWLLLIALVVTAGAQIYMLQIYPDWSKWLSPTIGVLAGVVVVVLILLRIRPRLNVSRASLQITGVALSVGMLALLLAPTVWSGYSVFNNTESSAPTAGPSAQSANRGLAGQGGRSANAFAGFGFGGGRDAAQGDPVLITYLEAHQGGAKFLVATTTANTAGPIILATNKPVMAMGGFAGGDPILSTDDLQGLIKAGTVRFFLLNGVGQGQIDQLRNFVGNRGGNNSRQSALSSWVSTHCSTVPTSDWQSASQSGRNGQGGNQLYDCSTPH